jgi:hypothetical protein
MAGFFVTLALFFPAFFWDTFFSEYWFSFPLVTVLYGLFGRKAPYWILITSFFAISWLYPLSIDYNLWISPLLLIIFYFYYYMVKSFRRKNLTFLIAFALFYLGEKAVLFSRWYISDCVPFIVVLCVIWARVIHENRRQKKYKSSLSYTGRSEW